MYSVRILDQNYNKATLTNGDYVLDIEGFEKIGKIFTDDIVSLDGKKLKLEKRNINQKTILGVLELYSKYRFPANKRNVDRYKFKPISNNYPCFLVASKIKRKYRENVLVTVKYSSWESKLPYGEIVHVIGPISEHESLCEGVLHKHNLIKKTIRFDKEVLNNIKSFELDYIPYGYTDVTHLKTLSIDPKGCLDIDDAFSWYFQKGKFNLGIHISDVVGTLNKLGANHIMENLTTSIYAPHRIINMFPTILSNGIISLLPGKQRLAITMWLTIDNSNIVDVKFEKTVIVNKHGLSYEKFEKMCKKHDEYAMIFNKIKHLNYDFYTELDSFDSHTFIEKMMIIYNVESAKFIIKHGYTPVFRTHQKATNLFVPDKIDAKLEKFINIIRSNAASYTFSNKQEGHSALDLDIYTHSTSPIRRFVDCYNHSLMHNIFENKQKFNLLIDLELINNTNKLAKKATRDFNKLCLIKNIIETQNHKYKGYIYDFEDETRKVHIYLPTNKISIVTNIFSSKLDKIMSIYVNFKNTITMRNNIKDISCEIPLFKLINMEIYTVSNTSNPYKNIIVKFAQLEDLLSS